MSFLSYDNPVIAFLTKACNMLIASFYWIVCSLPVVTLMPASAALYSTVTDCIFSDKKGYGLTRHFFKAFAAAWKPGWILSLLTAGACFFLYTGFDTARQIWDRSALGAAYAALSILVILTCGCAILFLAPALARFDGNAGVILRLALYFSSRSLFKSLLLTLLLGAMIWFIDFFPLVLVILPALFTDILRPYAQKVMEAYIRDNGLREETEEPEETAGTAEELSPADIDRLMNEGEDKHA